MINASYSWFEKDIVLNITCMLHRCTRLWWWRQCWSNVRRFKQAAARLPSLICWQKFGSIYMLKKHGDTNSVGPSKSVLVYNLYSLEILARCRYFITALNISGMPLLTEIKRPCKCQLFVIKNKNRSAFSRNQKHMK